jgi:phosphate transport system protein
METRAVGERTEGHTVRRYDGELSALRLLVLEMGGLVLDQVRRAVQALEEGKVELAREVIARDHCVNGYDTRVNEAAIRLLALRQPVAGDLRAIMAIAKTVAELERAGDEAKKIARTALHLGAQTYAPLRSLLADVRAMAALATHMLDDVLRALDAMDVMGARAVAAGDAELDREFRAASRRLSTRIMADARQLGHTIDALMAVKALERIGDHAKNIAEHIVYLVTGVDVRHARAGAAGRQR